MRTPMKLHSRFLDRRAVSRRQVTVGMALFALLALGVAPAFADSKEKDPDEIGNRDVGKGVNFYSVEKEIALGKQMAQEVERQAKDRKSVV